MARLEWIYLEFTSKFESPYLNGRRFKFYAPLFDQFLIIRIDLSSKFSSSEQNMRILVSFKQIMQWRRSRERNSSKKLCYWPFFLLYFDQKPVSIFFLLCDTVISTSQGDITTEIKLRKKKSIGSLSFWVYFGEINWGFGFNYN